MSFVIAADFEHQSRKDVVYLRWGTDNRREWVVKRSEAVRYGNKKNAKQIARNCREVKWLKNFRVLNIHHLNRDAKKETKSVVRAKNGVVIL